MIPPPPKHHATLINAAGTKQFNKRSSDSRLDTNLPVFIGPPWSRCLFLTYFGETSVDPFGLVHIGVVNIDVFVQS